MDLLSSVFLGIVQGLTEFLPVSSSGHLVLAKQLVPGFAQPGVLFEVILHLGTLFAVLIYFRKKIISIKFDYLVYLAIGTIPAFLFGFLFKDHLENMFANPKWLGLEFMITALICFLLDMPAKVKSKLNYQNSLLIGISQAIAIIPAISRSGATILAGVALGIKRKDAAEFSFLLSVPAIIGANLLEIFSYGQTIEYKYLDEYFIGFLVSFLVGFATIGFLLKMLVNKKFKYFGFYSFLLGLLSLYLF